MRGTTALILLWWVLTAWPVWGQTPVMPAVVGQDLEAAEASLRDAGIPRWQVLRASTSQGVGRIIRQSPVEGTLVGSRTYTPTLYLGVPERTPQKLDEPPPEPELQSDGNSLSWVLFLVVQAVIVGALWYGYQRFMRRRP